MSDVMYPYDDTGRNPANLVTGELQVLTSVNNDPYRYLIPTFAPFYETNFKMFGKTPLGVEYELRRYVDFNFNMPFLGASRGNGAAVWAAISIIRADIQGPLRLEYQCLGGKYSADRNKVVVTIAENNYNPRRIAWDQVTSIQEFFPPSNHPMDLDYFTSYRDMIDAIDRLNTAPGPDDVLRDLIWKHILDHNDPHKTLALLGDYAKKTDVAASVKVVSDRLDATDQNVAKNTSDINDLKQSSVGDVSVLRERVDTLEQGQVVQDQKIQGNVDSILALSQSLNTEVQRLDQRITEISQSGSSIDEEFRQFKTAQTQSNAAFVQAIATNSQAIQALNSSMSQNINNINRRIDELEQQLNNTAGAINTSSNVPEEFAAKMVLVTTPHARFMIWDEDDEKYVRAPWHQPGMVVYSNHNPGNGISGYLLASAGQTYVKEEYPDLVAAMGLTQDGGVFTLVELRGEFIRVLDNGRGIDVELFSGRAMGSAQGSQNLKHTHSISATGGDISQGTVPTTGSSEGGSGADDAFVIAEAQFPGSYTFPVAVNVGLFRASESGGDEARPRNVALPAWISI